MPRPNPSSLPASRAFVLVGAAAIFAVLAGRAASAAPVAPAPAPTATGSAAERGAAAELTLRERLEARAHTLPGGTQYLVGATLQADAIAARRRQDGDEQDTLIVSSTPFGAAPSAQRLSVRSS